MERSGNIRHAVTVGDIARAERCSKGRIAVIDDAEDILVGLAALFEMHGYACDTYISPLQFLADLDAAEPHFPGPVCVLCDIKMPDLDGLELQKRLVPHSEIPLVFMSGESGASEATAAFKGGALDFLIKPFDIAALLAAIEGALAESSKRQALNSLSLEMSARIDSLTAREREVARLVAQGVINRDIAGQLGIALRTVKLHRQRALEKLEVVSMADLIHIFDKYGL